MTYNILGNRRRDAVAAVVRSVAPDLLVVQESFVWGSPLSWCAQLADGFAMVHASGGLRSFGNLIFVARGVAVLDAWAVRFPFSWSDAPRGAAFARCALGSSRFVVAGSHLSPSAELRGRQAGVLKGALDRISGPLVAGVDVNETPDGAAWARLNAGLLDCAVVAAAGEVPTYSTSRPVRRIDALFVSPTVTVTDYRVPDESQVRAASDHFPVVADVAVP
jgi:endonuclease/exonuclease/phosphatase family metal-dependent hydrolase